MQCLIALYLGSPTRGPLVQFVRPDLFQFQNAVCLSVHFLKFKVTSVNPRNVCSPSIVVYNVCQQGGNSAVKL